MARDCILVFLKSNLIMCACKFSLHGFKNMKVKYDITA